MLKRTTIPTLLVRDFPEELYAQLKICAAKDNRSLSQQAVHVLREYLQSHELTCSSDRVQASSAQAPFPGSMYYHADYPSAAEKRKAQRQTTFEAIDAIPKLTVPNSFPAPASMICQMREERNVSEAPL